MDASERFRNYENENRDRSDDMQIHLCKPGSQREGPYTLERINADLAAGKYTGSDYWAWHLGLPEWVPLYSLPGVLDRPAGAASAETPARPSERQDSTPATVPTPAPPEPETTEAALSTAGSEKLPSGMPFSALEHSFFLTSGDGPAAVASPVLQMMLQAIVGQDIETIQRQVPRDIIGQCNILEGLKGATPGVVWQKMATIRPDLIQEARQGAFRICIRSFRIENDDIVSVFLFYDKQKL